MLGLAELGVEFAQLVGLPLERLQGRAARDEDDRNRLGGAVRKRRTDEQERRPIGPALRDIENDRAMPRLHLRSSNVILDSARRSMRSTDSRPRLMPVGLQTAFRSKQCFELGMIS